MPNIGGPELALIIIVFTLLFGARKLPELGQALGETIRHLRHSLEHDDTNS